jgi:hypothetical protein
MIYTSSNQMKGYADFLALEANDSLMNMMPKHALSTKAGNSAG